MQYRLIERLQILITVFKETVCFSYNEICESGIYKIHNLTVVVFT